MEDLALLTLPLRLVCAVGGKGKCAKCARARNFQKCEARAFSFFLFVPAVKLLRNCPRLLACLSASFFVAVGVQMYGNVYGELSFLPLPLTCIYPLRFRTKLRFSTHRWELKRSSIPVGGSCYFSWFDFVRHRCYSSRSSNGL